MKNRNQLNGSRRASRLLLALTCGFLLAGCRDSQSFRDGSVAKDVLTSTTPPFATKEPERYRATRTITVVETATNAATPVNETRTFKVLIMRDGDQRREEHETGSLGRIVYLENAAGRFVFLPQANLYADLVSAAGESQPAPLETSSDLVSPDLLLNETRVASRYERLGAETIDGRVTTKYRVTNSLGTETTSRSESFIWIDEAFGMPIRSESIHTDSDRSTRILMELKEIRSDVDAKMFALPPDYREVSASAISDLIRQSSGERGPRRKQALERE